MAVRIDQLTRRFHGQAVLKSVSFQVEPGELVSIVGPSGVGKTTLLRCIAGLEAPAAGRIEHDPRPTKDRPVIMVFQDYLLFPNLNVFENVAFGLRARRRPRREIEERVRAMLGYFHLEDKARAYPNQLSAGQKQRTAIARAMVVEPALLLLDAPFANLDPNLKLETAEFIRETQKSFGVTTISVTHDLSEAFVMSDRIGLLLEGELVQYAPPGELYHRPANLGAASFLGPVNILSPRAAAALGLDAGNGRPRYVRPEALELTLDPLGPGRILQAAFAGHYLRYLVDLAGSELLVYSLNDELAPGDRVQLRLRAFHEPPVKET